jgi:hypothetical protein
MKKFDKLLQEELDQKQFGFVGSVINAAYGVKEIESRLHELVENLRTAVESLNAQLALEIRKRMPKLQVNLSNGKCHVNYKSKSIVVYPDPVSKKWDIEPNDMGRRFSRGYPDVLPMQDDLGFIAEAVCEYFSSQYRTLHDTHGSVKEGQAIHKRGKSKPGNTYYS